MGAHHDEANRSRDFIRTFDVAFRDSLLACSYMYGVANALLRSQDFPN